jgi:pimeloyl-ACP methyl ester carboxylesterase
MPKVKLSQAEIEYEVTGEGRPLLLVAGLGMQLIHWPDGFVAALAARGFRVIRFDPRDSGRSTTHALLPRRSFASTFVKVAMRRTDAVPYTMVDLARDGVELLDALGEHGPVHVVGASMGGAVAQVMAVYFPERVKSLVSMSSTTGNPRASLGGLKGLLSMLTPPARTREEAARVTAPLMLKVGSKRYPRPLHEARALALRAFDRGADPSGHDRLFWAMMAAGDRTAELAGVRCPTLILHGKDDFLVPLSGGVATHQAIRGSRFRILDDMGHDLPEPLWPELVEHITAHALATERASFVPQEASP